MEPLLAFLICMAASLPAKFTGVPVESLNIISKSVVAPCSMVKENFPADISMFIHKYQEIYFNSFLREVVCWGELSPQLIPNSNLDSGTISLVL